MDQIVEVKYDSQFNQIENLTWYPWVGKDYEDGKRRIFNCRRISLHRRRY